jgi:hypothetical protein
VITLTEFLLARIAEDEAMATAAVDGGGLNWTVQYGGCRIEDDLGSVVVYDEGSPTEDEAAHIARWDPARVLAECEAKRRIVKLHEIDWRDDRICGLCERNYSFPCPTVRALTLPYADHPDFQQEWAA